MEKIHEGDDYNMASDGSTKKNSCLVTKTDKKVYLGKATVFFNCMSSKNRNKTEEFPSYKHN